MARATRPRVRLALCALATIALAAPSAAVAQRLGGFDRYPSGPYRGPLYPPAGSQLPFGGSQSAVCGQASAGAGECLIHVLQNGSNPAARSGATEVKSPTGLSPEAIKTIYGYSKSGEVGAPNGAGAGETIALVDAYNDPDAAANLETFSHQYGLPAASFTQVNQEGGSSLPATESGWDLEISLDIEWAHALAPDAHILLVEAKTNSLSNLLAAETYAAEHASYVSNSWGSSEFSSEASYDSYFAHPGVSYFAAAGDEASSVLWPSASPAVTSVGGTSLTLTAGDTLAQEEAWSGSGGGCSRYETANKAQKTGSVSCAGKRATPDVSLDANPNSGVSVYDGVAYEGRSGWWTVGGTSASTVMTAADSAVYGKLVDPAEAGLLNAGYIYAEPALIPFRDITLGSNGHPTLTGYDLATGLGSWSYTPGAPVGVTAARSGTEVKLSWSAPSGAPVSEYAIWRSTATGAESELVKVAAAGSGTQTHTETVPSGSATYYYEVQALNAAGSGPFSGQAVAAPPSKPPLASFATSCSQATCAFQSTSTDEAGTIDAYAWSGGNGRTGSAASFSDSYSAPGSYAVTLKVTNTAGQSSTASGTVACTDTTTGSGRNRRTVLNCT